MRTHSHQVFQINLSAQHIAVVLDGLAELPFKDSNTVIKYLQQQMQHQLAQQAAVDAENDKAAKEAEIKQLREEDPVLAAAVDKAAAED